MQVGEPFMFGASYSEKKIIIIIKKKRSWKKKKKKREKEPYNSRQFRLTIYNLFTSSHVGNLAKWKSKIL